MSSDNVQASQGQTSLGVGLVGGRRRSKKAGSKKASKALMRHTRKVKKAYSKFLKLANKKVKGGSK